MKKTKKLSLCFMTVLVLSLVMSTCLLPGSLQNAKADSEISLSDPVILTDTSLNAGQRVTWDCIWFGSYPQTEIVNSASECGTYGRDFYQESDYIVDSTLYKELSLTNGWDSNGDITWNGVKYRRIRQSEVTYKDTSSAYGSDSYYNWNNTDATYHYFRYEPVKWRILKIDGNKALLLSDLTLDDQMFCANEGYSRWTKSTLRGWLNGYDISQNKTGLINSGIDYSDSNFIDAAFSSEEQEAILSTDLDNAETNEYSCDYGNETTTDKVFLLAAYDLYNTNDAMSYGFLQNGNYADEARQCMSSTYAKAMGVRNFDGGKCCWWSRSPGNNYGNPAYVNDAGRFNSLADRNSLFLGVRPAMYIDITSSFWSNAGTVCSDGTVDLCANGHTWVTEPGTATCTQPGTTDYIYCSVCGEVSQESETVTEPLGHQKVIDEAEVLATCTSTGYSEASHCARCGAILSEREVTPKTDHTEYWEEGSAATLMSNGITAECYCPNCGEILEEAEVIPRINKVCLSYSSATYSGKVKSPVIMVYDKAGKKLTENIDYIVSTPAGRKNVGVYKYKVTFFGSYEGTKTLTLTINPKGTTISKLTALTKSFKVTWKKYSTQTSGYQLQYSTSGAFKSAKTVTVSGTSTTTKTIKSLKAKTKYYVRIRTYKKVSGKKYYSAWSAKKYVKTK